MKTQEDSAIGGNEPILIVDDEEGVRSSLAAMLTKYGYRPLLAANGREALSVLENERVTLILSDLMMPEVDGIQLLNQLRLRPEHFCVVIMSAYGTFETAIEAVQLGAYDYIAKPFHTEELLLTIRKAQERERLRLENEHLKAQVQRKYSFDNIIAQSAEMRRLFEIIQKIAEYRTTVMLLGESGTGKELIARAIHFNSSRKNKPFIAINCGAIPENLLESELFGHKKGSFTDATRDKRGLFEEAQGGTILLDEIGEMPLHLQVKLLRVLQESEIRPVGDSRVIPIDVRIIAATLRDLEQDVIDGRFRDDLYYRLHVVTMRIPPLRERRDDIPLLINYFIKRNQDRLKLQITGVEKEALAVMLNYSWPGNIRELENCIERAMILTESDQITVSSLPKQLQKRQDQSDRSGEEELTSLSIKEHTKAIEERLIRKALEKTKGNRTHAAKLLEISHRTLLYKLKEYNLESVE